MPTICDCLVIGLGGVGSAALRHLAARGVRAIGIERFGVAHDRGSSHGETRVIRQAYFEHPDYVPLLRSAYGLWDDLAAESGDLHVAAFARFDLHLPTDDLFLRTELTHAEDHRIVAVEGGVAVSAEEPS